MYSRMFKPPAKKSFFLFGPRGTGKTTWLKKNFPKALYLDLLNSELFNDLFAQPSRLEQMIPKDFKDWVILDEVQKIPALLNEVHRLIEGKKLKFILTGSSARKLRQKGVNLLAGRALNYRFYPLTVKELSSDFNLEKALQWGYLPSTFSEENPRDYLETYVMTYLEQEVQQEGLVRNLAHFSRFLEAASFSQGQTLNYSEIAREAGAHRKAVENYFSILEDLMIAYQLPVFTKKAKRRMVQHKKFYFFDVGVYRTLRPKGPLDRPEEIEGAALETLVFQGLKAMNDYLRWNYDLFYWRTSHQAEVDFVLYGEKGIVAIEVKRSNKISSKHLSGLKAFRRDYPQAKAYLLYGGERVMYMDGVEVLPVEEFLRGMEGILG